MSLTEPAPPTPDGVQDRPVAPDSASPLNGQIRWVVVLGLMLVLVIATIVACQYTGRIDTGADTCSIGVALTGHQPDTPTCTVTLSRDLGSICLGITSVAGVVLWMFTGAVLRDLTRRLRTSGLVQLKSKAHAFELPPLGTRHRDLVGRTAVPVVLCVVFLAAWLILRGSPRLGERWWAYSVPFGLLWLAIGVAGATCSTYAAVRWWKVWRKMAPLLDEPTKNFTFVLIPSREASAWGALTSLVTLKIGGALLSAATLLSSALLVLPAAGTGRGLALEIVVGVFALYCVFSVSTYFPVRRAVRRAHGAVWLAEIHRVRDDPQVTSEARTKETELILSHSGLPALGFGGVALRSLTIVTTGAAIVRALTLFGGSGT